MSGPHAPIPTEPVSNPEDPGTLVPIRGTGDESTWFTRHWKNIARGLYIFAGLLALLDFAYTKHSHFHEQDWFAFAGVYGFVGCTMLVMLAKLLRKAVMRPEDYWDA